MEENTESKVTAVDGKVSRAKVDKNEGPNEAFLGSVLVFILLLLVVTAIAFFAYFGYRVWKESRIVKNIPSIDRLASEPVVTAPAPSAPAPENPAPTTPPAPTTTTPSTTTAPADSSVDKATLEIKVLNGGAAVGTAKTYADTLVAAGFTKTAYGNSSNTYQGVTIYFATGKDKEAEFLKTEVAKKYPNVTTAKAVPGGRDSTQASLVVILGQ